MNVLKESFIYQWVILFMDKLETMIKNSGIYGVLTKKVGKVKERGFLEKGLYALIDFFRKIFYALRLNKILEGSVLVKPHIWVGVTIALAPFLETMQILLLVLATFVTFVLKILFEKDFQFRYTPVNASLIIFMLIYGAVSVTSLSAVTSMKIALLLLSFMAFYFVIINSITTSKQLHCMVGIFVGVGFIVSLYGIYQYLYAGTYASSSFVDKKMFADISTRVTGTFDNPNVMGEYLLLVISLALAYLFQAKGVVKKGAMLIVVGVIAVALAVTYSRGCYLGLIACIGVFLVLVNFKWVLLFLAGALAIPFVLPESILNRFTSIGNTSESSTSYRIAIWKGALDMIKDYWYRPIGQGTAAFNRIYPLYSYSGVGAEHTHNLFLQLIVETGILGILSFIVVLFRFFQYLGSGIQIAKEKLKDKNVSIFLIAFVSGMTGFMVQSMFDNTWYNNRIVLIFWIFIALGCAARALVKEERS